MQRVEVAYASRHSLVKLYDPTDWVIHPRPMPEVEDVKASRFNFQTNYPKSGETLLFNTLTGAFLAAPSDTAERIERLLRSPERSDDDPDLALHLLEQGYLVHDDVDEHGIVLERSRLGIQDPNRLDVIVMPNMNCNFACTYCYETHTNSQMNDETAKRLITWLESTIPRFKVVLLSWFGGEPTLSYPRMVEVQRHVLDLCKRHDVNFASHITTNGYLLTPERSKELVSLGLLSYQITLDGASGVHDAMRPLRGGGATFERILENIRALVAVDRRINVKLRINYNETNLWRVPELLHSIPHAMRPQLNLVLERIFGTEYSKFVDHMPTRDVAQTVEQLYQHARELGYAVTMNPTQPENLSYCYADRQSQVVVNFNGDIFKCTVDKFESKDRLGSLSDQGAIAWEGDRVDRWHGIAAFEDKCFSCTFMPMCMGGCRKIRGLDGTVGDACKLPFAGFDKRLQYRYANEIGDDSPEPSVSSPARRRVSLPVLPSISTR